MTFICIFLFRLNNFKAIWIFYWLRRMVAFSQLCIQSLWCTPAVSFLAFFTIHVSTSKFWGMTWDDPFVIALHPKDQGIQLLRDRLWLSFKNIVFYETFTEAIDRKALSNVMVNQWRPFSFQSRSSPRGRFVRWGIQSEDVQATYTTRWTYVSNPVFHLPFYVPGVTKCFLSLTANIVFVPFTIVIFFVNNMHILLFAMSAVIQTLVRLSA